MNVCQAAAEGTTAVWPDIWRLQGRSTPGRAPWAVPTVAGEG